MSQIPAVADRGAGNGARGRDALLRWAWAAAFCATYVALDWASYIDALHKLNITPWNPAPALGLLFLLRGGAGGVATLGVTLVASDLLVRDLSSALPKVLVLDFLLAAGYMAIARMLERHAGDGGMFSDRKSMVGWTVVVILGSLANSVVFVSALVALGMMPVAEWSAAVVRFWVGDGVGIFVTFPLFWWVQDTRQRTLFFTSVMRWETLGYMVLAALMLYLAFMPTASGNVRYLYILFLPLVWASSRQGLIGAIFCASLLQVGMLVAGWLWQAEGVAVFELQVRALLFAGVGFLIGIAVDEQRRAVQELRHTLRLAAAGEMAAALAHELNQPLTALSAYGSAIEQILQRDGGSDQLRDVIRRMVGEAGRAAEVVRRLRDFFRTGSTRLEHLPLDDLMAAATRPFLDKAPTLSIDMAVAPIPNVRLHVDRLQIEVVLRNLLSNAFDAVTALPADRQRRVTVTAEIKGADQLGIRVEDSGGGLTAPVSDAAFEPFVSTKSSGLGLGLAISRAIAEAHGGSLVAVTTDHGCFILFLPIDPPKEALLG